MHVIKHYYPAVTEQLAAAEAEEANTRKITKVARKSNFLGGLFLFIGAIALAIGIMLFLARKKRITVHTEAE